MGVENIPKKRTRFKGAILYTVLAVMFVMIILIMITLTLAGVASNRAYNTWFDNQSEYTAQSLVDGVIESFRPGQPNEDVGKSVISSLNSTGATVTLDVKSNGSSYVPGYGEIKQLKFEYVGDNGTGTGDYLLSGASSFTGEKIIKVSAMVEMGGQTSTYSQYVIGNVDNLYVDASGGGYNAIGSNTGGAGSDDTPTVLGNSYAGIDVEYYNTNKVSKLGNETINAGDVFYNSTLDLNSGKKMYFGRNDPAHNSYSGLRVVGDLTINTSNMEIVSQYKPLEVVEKDGQIKSNDKIYNLPYIFTNGKLSFKAATPTITGPFNFYCNSFDIAAMEGLSGKNINLICLGEEATSKAGTINQTTLLNWASSQIGLKVDDPDAISTGNIYTKGNLDFPSGTDLKINGNLYVEGELMIGGVPVESEYFSSPECKIEVPVDSSIFIKGEWIRGDESSIVPSLSDVFGTPKDVSKDDAGNSVNEYMCSINDDDGKPQQFSMFQSLDNVRKTFFKDGSYIGAVETSGNVNTKVYEDTDFANAKIVIDESCEWKMAKIEDKTIEIKPNGQELWIDLNGIGHINRTNIIVDDTHGGSVKFFVKATDATGKIVFENTKIVTSTYNTELGGGKQLNMDIEKYPDSKYVPHIYMYAPPTLDVNFEFHNGNNLFTGDIIAPSADSSFSANATPEYSITGTYTMNTYIKGASGPKKINHIKVPLTDQNVTVIGSIEVTNMVGVTNTFGYLYVDDPPFDTGDGAVPGTYSWTILEGYSNGTF